MRPAYSGRTGVPASLVPVTRTDPPSRLPVTAADPVGSVPDTQPSRWRRLRHRLAIDPTPPPDSTLARPVLRNEVLLVLAVSLGASAVYSVLSLLRKLLAPVPLSQSQATLNGSVVPNQAWLDLVYQLVGIGFGVVPALLALYLLARDRIRPAAIGVDGTRPRWDLGRGALLAAVIGIPGLLLYLAAYALGISATIVPSGLPDVWWRVPVLVLSAAMNATLEEVVVVGYLITRLRQLGRTVPWAIGLAALLRGSYHLYQGFGAFIGNALMGVVFGWFFLRTKRVMPLIVAHTILDTVSFVGYTVLAGHVSWLP
jgi:membrane protease YdiL (CAAX protease family)